MHFSRPDIAPFLWLTGRNTSSVYLWIYQRSTLEGRDSAIVSLPLSFGVYTVSSVSRVNRAVFCRSSLHPYRFVCSAVSVGHWPNGPPQAVMVWTPLQNVFCCLVLLATGAKRRRDQLQFFGQVVHGWICYAQSGVSIAQLASSGWWCGSRPSPL